MKPERKTKPERKAKNIKVPKKKGNNTLIIAVAAVIILAGIAYAVLFADSTNTKKPESEIKLPSYAYTNPLTLKAYRYATEHPDILEQIPCYCGCGGHSGHRWLRDCYIHDDWTYDEHASFCDVCIGEAIKVQDYLASGMTLKEARAKIDAEYSVKGDRTNTPPVSDYYKPVLSPKIEGIPAVTATPAGADLSKYNLPDNFNSLADGLKLTPAGVNRAYFINTRMIIGTEMEAQYSSFVEPDAFYGKKLMGMYSGDYGPTSWIEMHDLGYDNTKDAALKAHNEPGMKNIVYTRPLVYGHAENVDNVMKLMKDPTGTSSYQTYKPLLDAVDYQNAAFAQVLTQPTGFSDINYVSLTPVNGGFEFVKVYNITDTKSVPAAFNKYSPQINGNLLIIKVTGDLKTVQAEIDNIEGIART